MTILTPLCLLAVLAAAPPRALKPIPERLVVLTFDDASKSHFTVARPLLKKYGFGATFFVTEGFDFPTNKRDYMTWEEIAALHKDGFEIGNHTLGHVSVTDKSIKDLAEQVRVLAARCNKHGIPTPTSFAYPGNAITPAALPILRDLGIRFARRGGAPEYPYKEGDGPAYEPGLDHPLLIPSAGDARPGWKMADFERAVAKARHGRIAVLQFHGVPDTAHAWVNTSEKQLAGYMKHLHDNGYRVIAMRDLAEYVDPSVVPSDPLGVIADRQRLLKAGLSGDNGRPAKDDADLGFWLRNMVRHGYEVTEMAAALGAKADEVRAALERLKIDPKAAAERPRDRLLVLPYPGGRHPRIGFLDGAIRPRRETKVSVFAPWAGGGYAVVDVPEAIWWDNGGKRELLYLAHTHIPTTWDRAGKALEPLEWRREEGGVLAVERRLPNGVVFGAKVTPGKAGVGMELWLTNGTEKTLKGLNVQVCTMLRGMPGFAGRSNDNKAFAKPFAACRDASGTRWIITGWGPCVRTWANAPCPCLHSDPAFPDCGPGKTVRVKGWLSFHEGKDVEAEIRRLRKLVFAE